MKIFAPPRYNVIKTSEELFYVNELKIVCCICLDTLLSGSPILQNGKIVGAVTHVLVNDPTRGYVIFIVLQNDNFLFVVSCDILIKS